MVTIAVKKIAYRSVEILFHVFVDVGEGHLGIYRPPGGFEVIFVEHFADETILRLLPARVCALGQWIGGILFPLVLALSLRTFFGLLGSERGSNGGRKVSVLWYAGNLEGP